MIATSAAAQDFYLEPPYGSPGGGDTIKFEAISPAIDFRAALPEVLFAGISAVVTVIDSKTLTAVTPPHKEGAVEVQLRLDGTTYTTPYKFGYIVPREPILIPLAIETPGAYGTRWTTDIWVYNDAEEPVNLLPEVCFGFANPFPCGEGLLVGSHGSIRIPPYVAYNDLSVYTFLYPPTAVRNRLHFSVRIRNAADPDDVGAEIPVVPLSQFRRGRVVLLNVPVKDRFRAVLRIYDSHEDAWPKPVAVRVYDSTTGELLARRDTGWPYPVPSDSVLRFVYHVYDVLDDAGLHGHDFVRIEIEEDDALIWAMLTLTDKSDQHVTVITSH